MTNLGTAYITVLPSVKGIGKTIEKQFNASAVGQNISKQFNSGFGDDNKKLGQKITSNLANIQAGFQMAVGAAQKVGQALSWAGELSKTQVRLNQITDGTMSQAGLQDRILKSAKELGVQYSELATSVSKLGLLAGEAFNGSTEKVIEFTSTMQKGFAISGAGAEEASGATRQITQALASGVLRGDEFNSMMENAPYLAQQMADSLGVDTGELRKMASEGKLTSDVVVDAIQGATETIDKDFSKVPMTFDRVMANVKSVFEVGFTDIAGNISTFLASPQVQGAIDGFGEAFSVVKEVVGDVFSKIGNSLKPMFFTFQQVSSTIMSVVQNIFTALSPILSKIFEVIGNVTAKLAPLISMVVMQVKPAIDDVINALMPLIDTIITILLPIIENIASTVMRVIPPIANVIGSVLSVISGIIKTVTAIIKGDWSAAWEGIKQIFTGVWDTIKNTAKLWIEQIKVFIEIGLNTIKSIWSVAWNSISSFFSGIWDGIKGFASGAIDSIVGFFQGLPGKIWDALSSLANIGSDLLTGLWDGISGASSWFLSKIGDFFGSLLPGWVKDLLGIHSPSKVFADIGKQLDLGLAGGIGDNTKPALKAVSKLSDDITSAFKAKLDIQTAIDEQQKAMQMNMYERQVKLAHEAKLHGVNIPDDYSFENMEFISPQQIVYNNYANPALTAEQQLRKALTTSNVLLGLA
jgi:tape measure domain-containing protein